jgi:hypothetical protein
MHKSNGLAPEERNVLPPINGLKEIKIRVARYKHFVPTALKEKS